MSSSGSSGGWFSGVLGGITDATDSASDSVSNAISGWGDLSLPSWLTELKEVSDTLYSFGKDPKGFILGVILVIIVEQVIGFATAVYAFVLRVFDLLAGIPVTILNSLGNAGAVISGGFWTIGGTIYGALFGVINTLGWTAPLVFALLFVILIEATEEFSFPVASALTDLLGAIPVIGSLVDAVLSLLINVARSLIGGES